MTAGADVIVSAAVSDAGNVTAVDVMRATPPFTDAVVQAVKTWRFTPALRKPANLPASTEVGLASSVISMSGANGQCRAARSMTAATVSGAISDGVPPPKKMLVSLRAGVSAA